MLKVVARILKLFTVLSSTVKHST